MPNKLIQCELPWGQASLLSNRDVTPQPIFEPYALLQEDLTEKAFNTHFLKEKYIYSFLLIEVLEMGGVSVQTSPFNKPTNREMDAIHESRWNLPRVLAEPDTNMCYVGVQCRGRMQGG